MILDSQFIEFSAISLGFSLCRVARAEPLPEQVKGLDRWLRSGYNANLGYMERNVEKRGDPTKLMEGSRSVVVCAVNYKNSAWQQSGNDKIASFALFEDYHILIKQMLWELFATLKTRYPNLEGRAFVDTAPILEKAWAERSGIGWRGKNSLIISPEFGSFILLGELVLNMEASDYGEPLEKSCGECRICIESCPVGAIVEPYVVDANRCISALTVEPAMRESLAAADNHGWLYGCDVCQSCCPHNVKTPLTTDSRFMPAVDIDTLKEVVRRA